MAWEDPTNWTYMGHGEWVPVEEVNAENEAIGAEGNQEVETPEVEPGWILKWRAKVDEDIKLHQEVLEKGYPNRWGARRPVRTRWNLDRFKELLKNYEDREVVEWLRYGWPTGRLPSLPNPGITCKNHKGTTDHPEALRKYISKERTKEAIMGPYKKIPFQKRVGIAPLSTRPKRESSERRIILDLSFPYGNSVNDGILKDNYLGFETKLTFPRVDDFAFRIYFLGKGCMMFKIDLSRYFRQLPLDPGITP